MLTCSASGYKNMFNGCESLTAIPQLPATTLATSCYESMFEGCSSLVVLPGDLSPVTSLATSCFKNMFKGCIGLTTAPELPVTTLAEACYYSMFEGCTGLTSAPDLPASALVKDCYRRMFYGCSVLNAVRCMATSGINTNGSTTDWLQNVAATGTFTQSLSATWPRSTSGIPISWTCLKGFNPDFPNNPFDPEEDF